MVMNVTRGVIQTWSFLESEMKTFFTEENQLPFLPIVQFLYLDQNEKKKRFKLVTNQTNNINGEQISSKKGKAEEIR